MILFTIYRWKKRFDTFTAQRMEFPYRWQGIETDRKLRKIAGSKYSLIYDRKQTKMHTKIPRS